MRKVGQVLQCIIVVLSMGFSGLAVSLTQAQQEELYRYGTITIRDKAGHNKGFFEFKLIPGASNIFKEAQAQWAVAAGKLMDSYFNGRGFWWAKVGGSVWDGIKYMRVGVWERGVFAIPHDFVEILSQNLKATGSFGASAGAIKNWLMFGGNCAARVGASLWGVWAGGAYAVMAPALITFCAPLKAGLHGVVGGGLWPIARFTWNGTMWLLSRNDAEPKPGELMVTWRPYCDPAASNES